MTDKLPDRIMLEGAIQVAFFYGYEDAKQGRRNPRTKEDVKSLIEQAYPRSVEGYDWRKGHWIKFRQVYGAGFDIAKLHAMIKENANEDGSKL